MFALLAFFVTGWLSLVPSAHAQGTGEVYVTGDAGAAIFLDGNPTGIVTPGMIQAVATGPHNIRAVIGCRTAYADLNVRTNAVERVDLMLAAGPGTVFVSTVPYGATVREGTTVLGVSPLGPIEIGCGPHTLVASAPGHQSASLTVEVPLSGHVDAKMDLLPLQLGAIAVSVLPFDAVVFVDGQSRGSGPMTVQNLAAGTHQVRARAEGYIDAQLDVSVVAEQISRATFALVVKPPQEPLGRRLGLYRVPWARVALNTGLSLASVGAGVFAYTQYDRAAEGYTVYQGLTYADDPDGYYATQVQSPRTQSYVLGVGAGLGALGSGFLWGTTHLAPPSPATDPGP